MSVKSEDQPAELHTQERFQPFDKTYPQMNRRATNYSEPHVQVKSEKFQPDECNSDSGETKKWVVCEGSLLKEVLKVDHTDWSIETSRDLSENIDHKVQHNCESVSEDTKKFTQHTSNAHEQHICATCGKSFTSSSQCSTHEQIHTDFKPNTCHICRQSFARPVFCNDLILMKRFT